MNYLEKRNAAIKKLFPKPVGGRGLVNGIINRLPFEAHVPSYQYLGPGSNLHLRLAKKIKPSNKLDEAALNHDIAYSKSDNLKDRHVADYKLEQDAWKRVKAPDASLGEKATAWLVTNVMKGKRAIGAGLKKKQPKSTKNQPKLTKNRPKSTNYTNYPVNLEESEKTLIMSASTNKTPVDVNVNLFRTKESIINETSLPLTRYQIKKLKKAKKENKNTIKLKLSSKQLEHFKQGGFLPALLAPAVATLATSIYNAYQNKKSNQELVEEERRHNRALEGKGVYMVKKPLATGGNLKKKKKRKGTGVYMLKKPQAMNGNGLLTELLKKKKTHR